jgi:hypothetical protein
MPERILSAQSSADFIEDPDILEFMTGLQSKSSSTMSLFDDIKPEAMH